MSHPAFDPSRQAQVVIAPASLHVLHGTLTSTLGAAAAGVLQEAGYATGQAHARALRDWLDARGEGATADLPLDRFDEHLRSFFRELGWGELSLRAAGAVSIVEARRWAEWEEREPGEPPAAHFTTGLLAGLLGALAGQPIAVLELEPAEREAGACRFAVGNEGVLNHLFDRLQQGEPADAVLEGLARGR